MSWVTQPGWILTRNDYGEREVCAIVVANHGEDEAVAKLKEMAYRDRHPRGGKNQLWWESEPFGWSADGRWEGQVYLVESHTVEVLS